ncbi:hypothetical protein [Mucilaginibacter terrae]|uniref:Tetratricopeptide repeat protein n=1 Tax=Mucilaginibacter terrae TaxID=1955052 RepID=A0ABU3H0N8_9SPHI|nr:hypothetical protein [Mucilaginibacter terrae]MDT3405587.1 hypothetical protein [Mucilaginibacter terrae]
MLLGANNTHQQHNSEEAFIVQLINHERYTEAYGLLLKEQPGNPATYFNTALCLYWVQNYSAALQFLDKADMALQGMANLSAQPPDAVYQSIINKQNQTNDHFIPVDKKYVLLFGNRFRDAIVRLKTDCWLQLNEWGRVIETATPLRHKNYGNITYALQTAQNKLSQS